MAKYRKRQYEAKHMFKMDNETIGHNLHAGAIDANQARRAYARAEKMFRAEMFNSEGEKNRGLKAIGAK